jgi:UDP-N-acetylbacillosamine N-acetyltransferase
MDGNQSILEIPAEAGHAVKTLVVWGASGHARVVVDIIRLKGQYHIVGHLDDVNPERKGQSFEGAPIRGGQEQLDGLQAEGVHHLFLAFGDDASRLHLAEFVASRGFALATAIHPRATIAPNASIGPGTVVIAGAVVNPHARVGANVIVNTLASVEHDCVVEDGVHLAPGVRLGGGSCVRRGARLKLGAIVAAGIEIGEGSIVGAGSVVLRDVEAGVLVHGAPARLSRRL